MGKVSKKFMGIAKSAEEDQLACEIGKELLEEGMRAAFLRYGRKALSGLKRTHPELLQQLTTFCDGDRKKMAVFMVTEQRMLQGKRPVALLAEGHDVELTATLRRANTGAHL